MANTKANRWAVLVGVDYYISGASRPGITFPNLKGCVEDVRQVREHLRQSFGVKDSHIHQLTATAPHDDSGVPIEDPSRWPTYENIIDVLQRVSQDAKPEDLVYLHYSGHGIRASTIFSDLKGDDSLDEALVPTNIACNGGRYIRDVEVAYLLQEMVKKELIVTVVLDCCHSGSADRGKKNHGIDNGWIRGIGVIDRNKLDSDISMFPHGELGIAARRPALGAGRKASVADHWLLESRGYAFLAACRVQESALEHEYGGRVQGVLTHSLLSTLKNNSQGLTYHRLWELVASKVREQSNQQNVVLGGEGDRLFYSGDRLKLFHASTVLKVDDADGRTTVRLNAGIAHGISVGMEFDVWPALCSDFRDSERLGRLSVTVAKDVTAEALLVETLTPNQQLEAGCRALPRTNLSLQRLVRLLYPESLGEDGLCEKALSAEKALNAAREAWKKHGTTLAPLIDEPNGGETFQVQVKDGMYEILDKNGQRLQHTILPLPIDDERSTEKLVCRLTHLAKYYNVQDLISLGGVSQLSVGLAKKPHAFPLQPRLAADPPSASPASQRCEATAGEWQLLKVRNESEFALNITVLDLDSLWAIEQIYPSGGAAYETLDPKKTLYLPLKVMVPDGTVQSRVLDTIKVFATVEPTSFRWLELPELDRETPRRGDAPNRGNALELLQAAMMLWESTPRKAKLSVPLGWDVKHATIEMPN